MTLLNAPGRKPEVPNKRAYDSYEGLRLIQLGFFKRPEPCNEPVAFRLKGKK